jgi:hypothetical protein
MLSGYASPFTEMGCAVALVKHALMRERAIEGEEFGTELKTFASAARIKDPDVGGII